MPLRLCQGRKDRASDPVRDDGSPPRLFVSQVCRRAPKDPQGFQGHRGGQNVGDCSPIFHQEKKQVMRRFYSLCEWK
ncbi:putative nuclear calmodulin-binding protein [Frog virus 3]|uniref:Uncharacterized protein 054L n=8 Tax=Ranavirus TaxID=10492 RepID=054L_FRG3G|nr:putative nuclear calmodulin-binding protein [Frog virus 3]Q6GZS2.1 RecName: Full=Uncharacterized protein 054L [Frog virus 3 (isolate Goorha)]AGV20588.1 nuclear calmodulin-binding protein [Andrias davidianus ranavirus]AHA80905.1 putative nuclear calmodulin-binding protein [Chinese giant salamander iridovirus]ANZ56973.1 putative nuclear calmodulin-binding protein [Pike-perch iridovirus]API65366.1 putative nuclear calmodulin-binding protein [Rana catesbeiana virus]ASU44201.1 putative nuclear 